MNDPPGGKGTATTDPNWASASNTALDNYITANGPFVGILGYSQGSMFTTYTVARLPAGTFNFAVMFCGCAAASHTLASSLN